MLAAENLRQSAQYGVEIKANTGQRSVFRGVKRATRPATARIGMIKPPTSYVLLYQGGAVSAQVQQAEGQQILLPRRSNRQNWMCCNERLWHMRTGTAHGREEAGLAQSESAHKTRDVYQNEYKLGKRNLNDLLTVEQDVFQAQSAEINANYDGWVAAVNYAAAVNNLIPLAGIKQGLYNDLPDLK